MIGAMRLVSVQRGYDPRDYVLVAFGGAGPLHANALAREARISAPISALGHQLWQAASRAAGPGASVSELVRWVEMQNGTEITGGHAGEPPTKANDGQA